MISRGALIVIEGLDRSGKSTQCKSLFDAFQKLQMKVEYWKYPNRITSIGTLINDYLTNQKNLNDNVVHLLFSANRWESVDEMKSKLNSGCNLVIDRYAYSGTAYTAAKEGLDFEWCKKCDEGLPKPDVVFFIDATTDILRARSGFGGERYENTVFQNKVYTNFTKFTGSSNFVILNGNESEVDLHKKILEKALQVIENCKNKEIQNLW